MPAWKQTSSLVTLLLVAATAAITFLLTRALTDRADLAARTDASVEHQGGDAAIVLNGSDKSKTASPRASGEASPLQNPPRSVSAELNRFLAKSRPMGEALIILRLNELSADEIPHALEFLKTQNEFGRATRNMWQTLWMRWAKVDFEAALEQAQSGTIQFAEANQLPKYVFGGLAEKDPAAAVEYISSHPEFPGRHIAVEGLASRWARKDPEAATQWALTRLAGDEFNKAIYAIPWGINASEGYRQALDWWRNLPDDARKTGYRSISDIHRGNTTAGLEDRIAFASAGLEHGMQDTHVLGKLGATLGQDDPARGIEVLTQRKPGTDVDSTFYTGLDTLFRTWGNQDSIAAGERLSASLDEPWANTAILGYARAIADVDPAAASAWVKQISDPAIRSRWRR